MAMTYNSLVGSKGSPGSIMTWVNYSKLSVDVGTLVDESQALLYTLLRCREMRTAWSFAMPVGNSMIPLRSRFLDPIGDMYCPSIDMSFRHKDEGFLQRNRNYNETNGSLGSDPFTTIAGSNNVTVNLPGNGFNQESKFYTTGATAFNGVTITGTFLVTSIVDADNFVIDITDLDATPSGSGSGGGSAATYTCDILVQGSPMFWAIWDEQIHFDAAFNKLQFCELLFFKSLPLLSGANQNNFLTDRYPHLLRQSIITQAADWMKEKDEYQKCLTTLQGMVGAVSAENDMMYRGAQIDTETP